MVTTLPKIKLELIEETDDMFHCWSCNRPAVYKNRYAGCPYCGGGDCGCYAEDEYWCIDCAMLDGSLEIPHHYEVQFAAHKTDPQRWWLYGNTSKPRECIHDTLDEALVIMERFDRVKGGGAYPRLFRVVEVCDNKMVQIGEVIDREVEN